MSGKQKYVFPASFAQRRLWFLDQFNPDATTYNITSVQRLRGNLRVDALEKSLNEIVRRHESLRTRFEAIDGDPKQVVEPELARLTIEVEDALSHEPRTEADVEKLINERVEQEYRVPFKLTECPLLRVKVVRLAEDDQVLLLSIHHIISDGWSFSVFYTELATLYKAFSAGKESPLPELAIQYADFSLWQREWVQGELLTEQLAYWRKQLEGLAPVLALPTDFARPAMQSYRGKSARFSIGPEEAQKLKALSRQKNVTLFMTVLAVFQILLYRYSGQSDIAVGTPIAGRNREEIEALIGCFVNTLVLRTRVNPELRFEELLEQVKEVALSAYAHQDVPFEKLVEDLHVERTLSYAPMFQVLFVMQNLPDETRDFGGLRMSSMEVTSETAKFDLTLGLRERNGRLDGSLDYNTDLFRGETAQRMLGHFRVLLEAIIADPEQRVGELPLLSEVERRQLLAEFNEADGDYAGWRQTIPEQFEAQVARTPEAIAVVAEGGALSYGELNRRANQVAHYLRRRGVGAEVLVGVLLERKLELVVGLLGVLKAGGAYVPLDGGYPEERLRFMMADSGMKVLLTEAQWRERVSWSEAEVVCLDSEAEAIAEESGANPEVVAGAGNLAYVIYTSGSTGRPKGVAIEHGSATVFLEWARRTFTASELGGLLASTSICFDLSVFELFAPLTSGGRVLLVENALVLGQLKEAELVRLVNTVPSAMAELVRLKGVPEGVTSVNLAGEALPRELANEVYGVSGVQRLRNLYGPSEATTYSTWTEVGREAEAEVTIGRAVTGTQVYVLDERQQLAPVGVSGELYIGGEGLARGYVGRAEVTAEKFVPHAYSAEGGARLYRTGDVGRYREDGELEYQGRRDHQVKVRGFRIELGEIEAVLRQAAAVREVVVVARAEEGGAKRLVAYIVGEREWSVRELREWLKEKLPEYMVPGACVGLQELPLTANGKVDRAALPAPDGSRPELEDAFVAPRTVVEQELAGIWSEVLKVKRVGVHDNFFDLGGHSLLATQVLSKLRKNFQVEVQLRNFFSDPTVAGLSQSVAEAQLTGSQSQPASISRRSRDQYRLSAAITRVD
jgi:amino acid adenylation domain-containing protein